METPRLFRCIVVKHMHGQYQSLERNITVNIVGYEKPDVKNKIKQLLKQAESSSVLYSLEDIQRGPEINGISQDFLLYILKHDCPAYMKSRQIEEYREEKKIQPKRKAWKTHIKGKL